MRTGPVIAKYCENWAKRRSRWIAYAFAYAYHATNIVSLIHEPSFAFTELCDNLGNNVLDN